MSKPARLYAFMVVAIGGLTLAGALTRWSCASSSVFLVCLGLALVGATFKVRLPGLTGTISPSFVPFLFAIGTMSWQETAIVAASAGIVQSVWRAKHFPTRLQIAFNGAMLAVSCSLAFGVSRTVCPSAQPVRFAVAALVFQVSNAFAVATILCLLEGSPLRGVWRSCHFWSFPYHLTGGMLAWMWTQANLTAGLSVGILGAVLLYSMSTFYADCVRRIGASHLAGASS